MQMLTTYQLRSDELNYELIDSIKNSYDNKNIIIDVYQNEDINFEVNEITNPEIIKRIKDINANKSYESAKKICEIRLIRLIRDSNN
jgi:hypothetical protein